MIYVEELIGAGHGQHDAGGDDPGLPGSRRGRGDTPDGGRRRGAGGASRELAAAGVDYDDVTETLELEGVQKFADSFDELLDGRAKREASAAELAACRRGYGRAADASERRRDRAEEPQNRSRDCSFRTPDPVRS